MATVILRGGLGNQMFEYAAGLNLALKKKENLVLDLTYLNDRFPRRAFTFRSYDLDIFTIEPAFTFLSKVSFAIPVPGVWLGLDFASSLLKKATGHSVLFSFSQGEKYFAEHAAAVREAFRFRHSFTGAAVELAKEIQQVNSVSLHVRRGDYTLPKYEKLYGATDLAYYDRAIAYIAERVHNPHFFVFSDDIAWCRKNIRSAFPMTYADDTSRGPKAAFHLQLMSQCKNNIIANSSFSWWGAWLNTNPQKIVVAPKHWSASTKEVSDILPEGWISF